MSQAADHHRRGRNVSAWLGIRSDGEIYDRHFYEGPTRADPPSTAWLLTDEDKARGFVRPVRFTYTCLDCGTDNDLMSREAAEQAARKPEGLNTLYCSRCRRWMCAGRRGHFVWKGSNERCGT